MYRHDAALTPAPARRHLPRGLRALVGLGMPMAQLGWVLVFVGSMLGWALGGGSDRSSRGSGDLVPVWLLVLAGVGVVVGHALRGRRQVRLLAGGRAASGTVVHRVPGAKDGATLSLDFEDAEGRIRRAEPRVADAQRYPEGVPVPLLHDPDEPEQVLVLAELPCEVHVDGADRLVARVSARDVLAAAFFPGLALLANLVGAASLLF
jgi:hypothetical protein